MHTAIGSFHDHAAAERAIDRLVQAGIPRHDMHLERREAQGDGPDANNRWDGMEREVAVDEGRLKAFGNFFAGLLGHGNHTTHAESYAQHVDRGGCVVVVDAHDSTQATRAQSLLRELEAGDLNLLDREGQRPLREIVAERGTRGGAPMDSSSVPYASTGNNAANLDRERAVARGTPMDSPRAVDSSAEVEHAPGLRYADKDKPLGS